MGFKKSLFCAAAILQLLWVGALQRDQCRCMDMSNGWTDRGLARIMCRGVAALAQLPNLQELRLAGTGAGGIVTGGSFSNERVLLDAAPKQRIWWMLDA